MKMTNQWMDWDDQRRKFTWCWMPAGTDSGNDDVRVSDSEAEFRGTVCLIHGLGEHGGRFQSLAEHFVSQGFRVLAFDQQGHGEDHRARGCIDSYDSLLDDVTGFLDMAARTNRIYGGNDGGKNGGDEKRLPLILLGHSMGGNLVANHTLRRNSIADAVIVSSPMLRTSRKISWWFETLCRCVKLFAPNFVMTSQVDVDRLMSAPAEKEKFLEDKVFHSQLSLRLAGALLDSGRWAIANASSLTKPMLLIHGTDDYLTSPEASREFADEAGEPCRLEIMEGFLHDTFRCVDRVRVLGLIDSFLADCVR